MPDLAVIIPTRGRPGNIRKVISAWDFTNAWDHADLILAVDADDPEYDGYGAVLDEFLKSTPDDTPSPLKMITFAEWLPMVHKLERTVSNLMVGSSYFALGFAGDDHLPQTMGWAKRYLDVLRELGTGMVYGDDGYQGRKLSTEWAVTSDVVRALGRMVPADVEHMYCDNAMMDLFGGAGAMRHLPEIRIEHMHPIVGKAETDEQYQRVNHRDQFRKDRNRYESWKNGQMSADVAAVRDLRKGRPDVTTEPVRAPRASRVVGSGPRKVLQRSGPTVARQPRDLRVPRHFRNVRAATPEDVMTALADFASQVPADQEIVELGVFQGRTALQLAWGASQGHGAHVTGIDPWDLPGNVYDPPFTNPESKRWAEHWVRSLGYSDKITLVQGFSHAVAGAWNDWRHPGTGPEFPEPKRVGLLYVDGDHTKEGARRDIESWAPHLAPGAIIAVDDYGHPDWPGVGEAVDELVTEGVLEPIEIFHDRLAVTRLTDPGQMKPGEDMTEAKLKPTGTVTAITAEGVATSLYPAVEGQVAATADLGPTRASLEDEWEGVDPEGVAELRRTAAEIDNEASRRGNVSPEESLFVEGTSPNQSIEDLNLGQLKALAKRREIVLGARKDKKAEILQALRDGR